MTIHVRDHLAFTSQSLVDATPIAVTPEIDALIATDSPVAVGVSGGKDSQAASIAVMRHLDRVGHEGPRILVHSDLGLVEWNDSLPVCQDLARHLGVELVVVRRQAGGLMERWEARWQSSRSRYEQLSTVTLVPCWSTPEMRFCTSELKTHVILAELKRRFRGSRIINVTGIRHDESRKRSAMTVASPDKEYRVWSWRPLVEWNEQQVFAAIDAAGLDPHPAYRKFGMSRVSCRFCIMQNIADMKAAAAQPEARDICRRMVDLEIDSTFAFQGSRWLGDIAPEILSPAQREALAQTKRKALARVELERQITKGMLYVKGWPTRMLTDQEAALLARVRRGVNDIVGMESGYLSVQEIHGRYAELMAANEARKALRPAC